MVTGVEKLRAQLNTLPPLVREEVEAAIEKMCNEMVREMRALAPLPEIARAIKWAWGDAPRGALKIGTFGTRKYGKISATIYVDRTPAFFAHWFEFGTANRYQKTTGRFAGRINAEPFFYPVVRSNRRLFRGRIRAAVNRAVKKARKA